MVKEKLKSFSLRKLQHLFYITVYVTFVRNFKCSSCRLFLRIWVISTIRVWYLSLNFYIIDISYYLPCNPNIIKYIWLHHDECTKHEINSRNILQIQRLRLLLKEDLSLEQQALVFVILVLLFVVILVVHLLGFQPIPLILHALVTLQTLYIY